MAKVKKSSVKKSSVKKAQPGCTWSRGEKAYRKPIGQAIGDLMWDMKLRRDERKQEREDRREAKRVGPPDRDDSMSTAPGVRETNKKGSQDFFGGEKNVIEAKRGKKVVKRAKVGKKVVSKSKKK
jgi:hypothetical protein